MWRSEEVCCTAFGFMQIMEVKCRVCKKSILLHAGPNCETLVIIGTDYLKMRPVEMGNVYSIL